MDICVVLPTNQKQIYLLQIFHIAQNLPFYHNFLRMTEILNYFSAYEHINLIPDFRHNVAFIFYIFHCATTYSIKMSFYCYTLDKEYESWTGSHKDLEAYVSWSVFLLVFQLHAIMNK